VHADGGLHLHAALVLGAAYQTTNVRAFDGLVVPSKHPNIQSRFSKGWKTAFKYVAKKGNYLALPNEEVVDLSDLLATESEGKTKIIATMVKNGSSIVEIDELYPEWVLLHLPLLEAYVELQESNEARASFARDQASLVRVVAAPGHLHGCNKAIARWLSTNLRVTRPLRTPQLWIQGPPRSGKTSLIHWLEDVFRLHIYYWPKDEKWWDGYADDRYDVIVMDEFFAQKTITELNQILSGDRMALSRRGRCPYVKRKNLPVIILSNFHPECCYHKSSPAALAPLLDRLLIVELCDGQHIAMEKEPGLSPEVSSGEETPEELPASLVMVDDPASQASPDHEIAIEVRGSPDEPWEAHPWVEEGSWYTMSNNRW